LTTEAETVDALGLKCPLPVLKAEKKIAGLEAGTKLVVLASDPMAKVDIPLFCMKHGHTCETAEDNGVLRFTITVHG
jgi:tRNA 2-thiouridine synthesizing protein A